MYHYELKGKIIKKYEDWKDARVKWYEKIVAGPDDRVKAEKGKYASIDFIENLETPVYGFKRHGKETVSVFISPVENDLRGFAQKQVNGIVATYIGMLRISGKLSRFGKKLVLQPTQKIAIVLTLEG